MSEILKTNSTLMSLDLSSEWNKWRTIRSSKRCYCQTENKVGAEGIKILIESLKTNSVLTNLDIRGKTEFQWVSYKELYQK